MRLKNRNVNPMPGGLRWFQPETNFSITPWSSFDSAVGQIIANRSGNSWLMQKNGWSVDPNAVAGELDAFNTKIAQEMGWTNFIVEGDPGSPPLSFPQPRRSLRPDLSGANVAAGVRTIADWEISGGQVVAQELADQRALVCATCPKNQKGDLSSWFTVPAAKLIQIQLETKNNMKLKTASDEALSICSVCACPLPLKVWCPEEIILKHLPIETKAALDPRCWILSEQPK